MGLGERRGYNILCAQRAVAVTSHVWTVVELGGTRRGPWSVWCVCVAMSARVFRLTRLSFRRDVLAGRRRRDHRIEVLGAVVTSDLPAEANEGTVFKAYGVIT